MAVQIYYLKKDFAVQKAERWFKERRIPCQSVDLKKHRLGRRELELFLRQVGKDRLFAVESKAWKECPAAYSPDPKAALEAACESPQLLNLPIVRNGTRVTAGFCPEAWEAWE
ncbi:MAG: ArsC family transcriptional regulator [Clostridia bacterium]|nr:ArsC family transcriptional regulator [Clostridia bacterium]